ncbi:hypothetical protein [Arenibaculum pallidiluteum]|uniref:hypothetical protein n=1 Tax=Arenibaculum pallidiluteum TaxID=2812559 RepID=UPI001A96A6C2|nr:hypothetical protein [Arenibaculum pallidiluteum]
MAQLIPLNAHREVEAFAEKVADVCRRRLLERPRDPVPIEHIMDQTAAARPRVEAAVAWLSRAGRLHLGHYALRSRPHVAIDAVDRIDDVSARAGRAADAPHA